LNRRFPQIAFAVLVLATIAAFFLVQALKTTPPLVWKLPVPIPAAFNPINGRFCTTTTKQRVDYRHTQITFSVHDADTVGVYVVSQENPNGKIIATVSAGTPMAAAPNASVDTKTFIWNGRLDDGQFAPDGVYYFRIVLEKEGRSIDLSPEAGARPVQVLTQPPNVKVLSVRLLGTRSTSGTNTASTTGTTTSTATTSTTGTSGGHAVGGAVVPLPGPAVLSPPHGEVRITFTKGTYHVGAMVDIYRTDVGGGPELVDTFRINTRLKRNWINWNGEIHQTPAPAGTYLIGITAADLACNKTQWPAIPVVAGSTAHAGVTVRYLSVTPPLTPTASGGRAAVAVDSASAGFVWQLRRVGSPKVIARGSHRAGRSIIRVRLPRRRSGLYTLTVRAGTQSAVVPLVASQSGAAGAHARVLVVLPLLTWMGDTPVDDSGDGLPDTLKAGDAVSLSRPLVDGLPDGFGDDAALLEYLDAEHLSYQLTTDVALAEGLGPSLADRGGVVFPAGENFLPAALSSTLRGFVRGGGRVLVLGTDTFSGTSHITGFPAAPRAGTPTLTTADPFGATRGPMTPTGGQLISELTDPLELFQGATEFSGFGDYQPISPSKSASKDPVSTAGIGSGAPAIVAFRYGSGTVVEVGLPGFGASIAHNSDSQELLNNAWQLLSQ